MASGTHVKRSGGGGRGLIIIIFIALVLAAAYLVSSMFFIFAGGSFISRNESRVDLSFSGIEKTGALLRLKAPAEIDLRGNDINAGDYKSLAAAFPDCVIRWDVPLGGVGETWDNFSESVKVPVYSPEAAELYSFLPNLKEIDLRDAIVTVEGYELLRSMVPDCRVFWNIPIGGEYYDSSSKTLSFGDVAAEDVGSFAYFDALESLVFTGSSHESYIKIERLLPECAVSRSVALGQTAAEAGGESLDLSSSGVSASELMERLDYLPGLKEVKLNSKDFSPEELKALREAYPKLSFDYDVSIGGKNYSCLTKELNLPGGVKASELMGAMPEFLRLAKLSLEDNSLSADELLALAEQYPDVEISADVELYGKRFATSAEEIDLSGIEISDTGLIERSLPLFPELEKVIMSDCGIADEDMDALNRRHEDVMFVWTIHFSVYDVRTDVKAFCASNVPGFVAPKLNSQQLEPIKYLTELEALDLGHMYYTDLSFLEYMPKLRYLILVEANYRDISTIAGLSRLYYLELFNNTIEDMSPLLECRQLRHLNIGYTRGYDASVLKEMYWLERLWLPGSQLSQEELDSIASALPQTDVYTVKWDGDGSTGGGWREHESYFVMRDMFEMHYMPGGTGVPGN